MLTDDSEVTTSAVTERQLAEMIEDYNDGIRAASEEIEPVEPTPAPERRTHPEYAAIKTRDTILGTIPVETATAFLAAVELKYNRPNVLAVDPTTGDVTYTGPANELLYGGRIIGPDEALELGTVIADHLGNAPLATIEVEPVDEIYYRAVRVYPWGGRIECAGLHPSPEAAAKWGGWMNQTERLTIAKVAVGEAGEMRRTA
jgi:hypothetical protein